MAYFITKAEVIAAAWSRKIEEEKIQDDYVEACGIRFLMPILGDDFYNAVVLTPASYVELTTYLVPVLANYVRYEILPNIYTEESTAGLNQFTGQNKRPALQSDLEALRQATLVVAGRHGERLRKYLEDNEVSYPLYESAKNPQNRVTIAGGIVFDNAGVVIDEEGYYNNNNLGQY